MAPRLGPQEGGDSAGSPLAELEKGVQELVGVGRSGPGGSEGAGSVGSDGRDGVSAPDMAAERGRPKKRKLTAAVSSTPTDNDADSRSSTTVDRLQSTA